ncbi:MULTISPECIES: ATP-binding protein [Pseudomonas syringae group]|uniref:ATP-binding protein n=1 Tax=Pseudomonas syringae group TaxID=136849 RepID=UPI000F01A2D7|nr:ATP-binding protein [Pseudomonas viridiflava]MCF9019714.1 AAA family ATPase [Pseudomonas syringae]
MMGSDSEHSADAGEVIASLSKYMNGTRPDFHIKSRPDGDYLIIEVAKTNALYFSRLNLINEELEAEHPFKDKVVLQERKKKPTNVLAMPEVAILRAELVQSLTVHRNSFKADFYNRYIPSVSDFESIIVTDANFVVYGRRGAGKSSLLAYAMHRLIDNEANVAWLAMQTYSSRDDTQAICSILSELFSELGKTTSALDIVEFEELLSKMGEEEEPEGLEKRLQRIIPRMRKVLGNITSFGKSLTIFIDDLHLLDAKLQPQLLATIYSLARGNNIYIKISGIEPLTRLWDGMANIGLQSPGDIQEMKLDYNLTIPDRSGAHIQHILDSHAQYCGLPNIHYIVESAAISRLVLSAAAVPRDALSLFAQSIQKSSIKGQKSVSITSINAAASESIESKLRDLELDAGNEKNELGALLERVKFFCITSQRNNAFLVKIDNSSRGYALVQKLAALRFAHVLHEGITPHKAGERYIALMLDFGFYVGIRAARSVELFLDEPRDILAKDLRKLPIFNPDETPEKPTTQMAKKA